MHDCRIYQDDQDSRNDSATNTATEKVTELRHPLDRESQRACCRASVPLSPPSRTLNPDTPGDADRQLIFLVFLERLNFQFRAQQGQTRASWFGTGNVYEAKDE